MSVQLNSLDGKYDNNVSNGTWDAITAVGHVFDETIPRWNGTHDPQTWSPEQLKIMADRIDQIASQVEALRELAAGGGVTIS